MNGETIKLIAGWCMWISLGCMVGMIAAWIKVNYIDKD
jgi:hypothetical protein